MASRYANHICQIVWAFSFCGRLSAHLSKCLQCELLDTGRNLDGTELDTQRLSPPDVLPATDMNAPRVLAKLRGILVIYKPPNWEVDAKRNKTVGSGRTRLLSHFVQDQETSRVVRLATFEYGFIHRLDVPSSGLVLVGTTFEGLATLQFQIHTYSIRQSLSTAVKVEKSQWMCVVLAAGREYAVLLAGCWPVAVVKVNMPVQPTAF